MTLRVRVKNLPLSLVFGQYNGQECDVIEEFHSRQFGTSLRVRAEDGREFTVGPAQYETTTETNAKFKVAQRNQPKPFVGPGLRRIQRYSDRCTT